MSDQEKAPSDDLEADGGSETESEKIENQEIFEEEMLESSPRKKDERVQVVRESASPDDE